MTALEACPIERAGKPGDVPVAARNVVATGQTVAVSNEAYGLDA